MLLNRLVQVPVLVHQHQDQLPNLHQKAKVNPQVPVFLLVALNPHQLLNQSHYLPRPVYLLLLLNLNLNLPRHPCHHQLHYLQALAKVSLSLLQQVCLLVLQNQNPCLQVQVYPHQLLFLLQPRYLLVHQNQLLSLPQLLKVNH